MKELTSSNSAMRSDKIGMHAKPMNPRIKATSKYPISGEFIAIISIIPGKGASFWKRKRQTVGSFQKSKIK